MRKAKRVPRATNRISMAPRGRDGADGADAEAARADHADGGTMTAKAAVRAAAEKAAEQPAAAKGKAEVCAAARAENRRPTAIKRLETQH